MIGMEYSPTDLTNPLIRLLGHPVKAVDEDGVWWRGHLADVRESGDAVIEVNGFVTAIVPASTIQADRC